MTLKRKKEMYIFTGIVFAIIIAPMLYTAFFAVPAVDDYSFGYAVHMEWIKTHSVYMSVVAAAKESARLYMGWQGTFSAIFLMCLQPAVFSESLYPLVTFIMLGSLISAVIFFCRACFKKSFEASGVQTWIISLVWLTISTQFLPSAVESFYWFNGSIYYTFFFSLSLFLYGNMCIWLNGGGNIRIFIMSLLSGIIGGGNYVTALISTLIFTVILFLLAILKDKRIKLLLIPFICLIITFIINIAAPGNAVRQSQYAQPNAVKAVLDSFIAAKEFTLKNLSLPLMFGVLCLVPVLYKIAVKSSFPFKFAPPVFMISCALFAAQFCPSLYAMQDIGPDRLMNIIYFSFVFAIIFNVFYIIGAVVKKLHIKPKKSNDINVIYAVAASILFFIVCYISPKWNDMTSVEAIRALKSGELQIFKQENDIRLNILKDETISDVVFESYSIKPKLLFTDDLRPDKDDWLNDTVADWYGKTSIVCLEETCN